MRMRRSRLVTLNRNAGFHHLSSCLAKSCFVDRSSLQLGGEPVIDTELSRTRADQPDKEEHVQDFRKKEEIVEPVKRRKSFGQGGNRAVQGGDNHIDQ